MPVEAHLHVIQDRNLIPQNIFAFIDMCRTSVANIRLEYLHAHPTTCPNLLILEMDYTCRPKPGQHFKIRAHNVRDIVTWIAEGESMAALLKAAVVEKEFQCVVTTTVDAGEVLTRLVRLPHLHGITYV